MADSDVVIRVEGLGKKYSLHHEKSERYTVLRDVVARQAEAAGRLLNPFTLAGQLRKAQRLAAQEHAASEEEFWALKDVSFEIHRGDRVGIIGRNGAGKSTLLKILSRITEPTTGRVEIRGRVASLLEVGTGFHPELTGRENIYLNGAILGMKRREICVKFDEIVSFAEVERFLDTPVKRYSSGMYVRLAFAVAAHLEPEILVVDEVLAVGDRAFQLKCLGKLRDASRRDGKTVLFVSHQMPALRELCDRGILLREGTSVIDDSVATAIDGYTAPLNSGPCSSYNPIRSSNDVKPFCIESAELITADGLRFDGRATFRATEEIRCLVKTCVTEELVGSIVYIGIYMNDGTFLGFTFDADHPRSSDKLDMRRPGKYSTVVTIPGLLRPGGYHLDIGTGIMNSKRLDHHESCLSFSVTDPIRPIYSVQRNRPGILLLDSRWEALKT